ncbi:MAG: glycosyltransferase, partial [Minisyncoccota bacterium]
MIIVVGLLLYNHPEQSKVVIRMPDHPKKILYAITKSNWGGAQRYVYDLATAAQAIGYDVVVAVGDTGPLTEKLASAGVRTVSLGLRQRKTFIGDLLTFGPLFSLLAVIRAERPDIVHVNSAKAGGLGALAARIAGVLARRSLGEVRPLVIFTAHGWEFNAPRSAVSKIGIRFFSWVTMLLAHQTIAVSKAIRRDVRRWPGVRRRITVIPNGIDCAPLLSREKARAALAPRAVGRYWVGMISELNPTKRIQDAISAFALIVPKHPEAILVVIGDGRERRALEELVRELHLRNHVSFAGFRSDASSLLKAFDLFVHTSSSEALGYVILEAGCAALPVVATRVGGIPEIICDDAHGLLVPPRDPEALAAAIESLMSDS